MSWASMGRRRGCSKPATLSYEPPGALHSVSRNASPRLKIVVFMVADAKSPSTVNEAALRRADEGSKGRRKHAKPRETSD